MHFAIFRALPRWGVLWLLVLLAGCAKDIPVFVPPLERPVESTERPWPANKLLALAYHDIEDEDPDQRFLSIRTDQLVGQLAWLKENGYQAVSVDQILDARQGGKPLPEKAVLLSFDDGYSSFYTRVYPILKAYGWPSILAPVGKWVGTPENEQVDFGGLITPRDRFLTWDEVREMSKSGLVEIGAHTNNLHMGILANPQGNQQPAIAVHSYDPQTGRYEEPAKYEARVQGDVQAITEKIRSVTGRSPRVWVWPYGAASGLALKIIGDNNYQMALTLEPGLGSPDKANVVPRVLLSGEEVGLAGSARMIAGAERAPNIRVAHVDLDYVYDPDPEQMERNVGALVQRIFDMQITTVFLQAFSDPDGDGLVKSVYFPNRVLPVRADLFNRVAWQLSSRVDVQVFAWMPVLSYDLDPALPRVTRWDPKTGAVSVDPDQYRRLSPYDPAVQKQIIELYEDLSRYTVFDGILYHDDALMSDFEDAGPQAAAAYRAAGLPDTIAALRANPETMQRWTRFKSRYLIDFTKTLTSHVRAIRGPQVLTARNIFAGPILNPESEAWFAQNLDDFLETYDWTAPMAMPLMEGQSMKQSNAWLDRLVDAVASRPHALEKTVFELQSRDWRAATDKDSQFVDSKVLAGWMERLQLRGVRSFGYYPDDFAQNQPRLDVIRPAISNAWYPFR